MFEYAEVLRRDLSFAEYNPRTISKAAFRKLKRSVEANGLAEVLVANRRTEAKGFAAEDEGRLVLVGGHQRVKVMDDILGHQDYRVPVAIHVLTPDEEMTLNIALNNPSTQGTFDHDMLEYMAGKIGQKGLEKAGFDAASVALLFDAAVVDSLFSKQAKVEAETVAQLEAIHEAAKEQPESETTPQSAPVPSDEKPSSAQPWTPERMAERREKYIARQQDQNDAEFMLNVVFDSAAQMDAFLTQIGFDRTQRYVAGYQLAEVMGLSLE